MRKSAGAGGPHGPLAFLLSFTPALQALEERWARIGWSFPLSCDVRALQGDDLKAIQELPGPRLGMLVWADNIQLFSYSVGHARRMLSELMELVWCALGHEIKSGAILAANSLATHKEPLHMVDPRPFLQPLGWWQDLVLPPAFAITEEQWATRGQAYMSQGFPVEVACVHDAMVALGARIPVDATEDCAWQHRMEIAEVVWH